MEITRPEAWKAVLPGAAISKPAWSSELTQLGHYSYICVRDQCDFPAPPPPPQDFHSVGWTETWNLCLKTKQNGTYNSAADSNDKPSLDTTNLVKERALQSLGALSQSPRKMKQLSI